jgi:hypothetical protein
MTGGGFEVASMSDGTPQSVSALRVTVDKARMSKLNISLTETTSIGNQFNHIRICRAAPGWPPANPGALADAPKMDCSAPFVDLVHRSGGWDGDLRRMLPNGGTASLGLVGVRDGQTPVNFFVELTGVSIGGQGSLDDNSDGVGNTSDTTEAVATPDTTFDGGLVDPSAAAVDPTLFPAAGTGVAPSAGSVTTDAPSLSTIAPSLAGPTRFASTTHGRGPARPWIRLVFLVPLSAMLGVGLVYGRRLASARGATFS